MSSSLIVNYYKLSHKAKEPIRATEHAACYDVHACFHSQDNIVKGYDTENRPIQTIQEQWLNTENARYIKVLPGYRYLIPTGIIFDIPEGYSIRIHPRSGLALKSGITVANCEGIVDSDYYHETFIMLINISHRSFELYDGDRIAQLEFHEDSHMTLEEMDTPPQKKTSRQGGFGHTGV